MYIYTSFYIKKDMYIYIYILKSKIFIKIIVIIKIIKYIIFRYRFILFNH